MCRNRPTFKGPVPPSIPTLCTQVANFDHRWWPLQFLWNQKIPLKTRPRMWSILLDNQIIKAKLKEFWMDTIHIFANERNKIELWLHHMQRLMVSRSCRLIFQTDIEKYWCVYQGSRKGAYIDSSRIYLCYFFGKTYVWPFVRIVSMRQLQQVVEHMILWRNKNYINKNTHLILCTCIL